MRKYQIEICQMSNGILKSWEIAEHFEVSPKHVQKIWRENPTVPRPIQGPPAGQCNPSWKGGRVFEQDGYVTIPGTDRKIGRSLEHRIVMENHLGRKLLKSEVVDHLDGCRLHNDIKNLRLFASNSEHLKKTLTKKIPRWSSEGIRKINSTQSERQLHRSVDTYYLHKRRGDVRLQQILLAHGLLDKDSPYLLGTQRYLEKAQIPWASMTQREFLVLVQKLAADRMK